MGMVDLSKREVWQRFIREGILDQGRIHHRIEESWQLCRRYNVNPYDGKGKVVLEPPLLLERKQKNRRLLQLAVPVLEKLQKLIQETKSLLLLIDRDGYVLYANGHQQAIKKAKAIRFTEGVKWTEDEVGTNAIGTALRIQEPITVVGDEHYSVASQQWICSATPIYNEKKELVGAIDLSCPINSSLLQDHALATVVAAAYTIEQRFQLQKKEDLLELFKYTHHIPNPHSPVVICDCHEKTVWMNHGLRAFLPNLTDQPLESLCEQKWRIQTKKPIHSAVDGELIGYEVTLQRTAVYPQTFHFSAPSFHFDGVAGKSEVFAHVLQSCEKAAKTETTVYMTGETGTGKEMLARFIHQNSNRKNKPFVAVNCGAIPKELIGSELFGYAEGAFTGAKRTGHKGKFVQANGGTLFLDEMGEIPPEMQVALLRVLQEREVVPIGGDKAIPVDVRIITATHRDLYKLVQEGKLREDLFYRIYVYPIHVPPLRERKEDIPFFIEHYCQKHHWTVTFSDQLLQLLMNYHWPGNIRELLNVLERIRVEYGTHLPSVSQLQSMLVAWNQNKEKAEQNQALSYREKIEKERMMNVLQITNGNVSKAAATLNISRSTLYRKLKKYQLM
jgi:sigma-54 dependent transcriptional regulator, acetoin dehydrogenase operon transcriptional activator AcoR